MPNPTGDPVALCLSRVGEPRIGSRTLLIKGQAETSRPPAQVWSEWTKLERWPTWSPIHVMTKWTSTSGFCVDATFEQEIALGFPIGTVTAQVHVDLLEPGQIASWLGNDKGVRSCHVWQFEGTRGGGTRVTNVEVFAGRTIPLLRPLVSRRWNKDFQTAVERLFA